MLCQRKQRSCAPRTAEGGCPHTRHLFVGGNLKQQTASSLLEQILKCRSRIVGLQTRRRRRFLFTSDTNLEQLAGISLVLLGDPLLHGLHALKAAARIEVCALLARVQFKPALQTFPIGRHALEYGPTLRTARHGTSPRQIHRSWSQCVIPLRRSALAFGRRFSWSLATRLSIAILISRLTVFGQKNLPKHDVLSTRNRPGGKCTSHQNHSPRIHTDFRESN